MCKAMLPYLTVPYADVCSYAEWGILCEVTAGNYKLLVWASVNGTRNDKSQAVSANVSQQVPKSQTTSRVPVAFVEI